MPEFSSFSIGRWITLIAYAMCVVVCVRRMAGTKEVGRAGGMLFLAVVCVGLLGFRLFGFDNVLAAALRQGLSSADWDRSKRAIQATVCLLWLVVSVAVLTMAGRRLTREALHRFAFLLAGLLVGFAGVRSVSLHQVDELLALRVYGAQVNWLIEIPLVLGLLACVWAGRRGSLGRGRP